MSETTYRPCLMVRLLAPRLPRSWQELMVHNMVSIMVGWQETKKIAWVFGAFIGLSVSCFVLGIVGLCWLFPFATPAFLVWGLIGAWYGHAALGLSYPDIEHRQWVKSQVNSTSKDTFSDFVLGRVNNRWKLDLLLVYGRPQSASELELLWLGKETIEASPQVRVRPRL